MSKEYYVRDGLIYRDGRDEAYSWLKVRKTKLWVAPITGRVFHEKPEKVKIPGDLSKGIFPAWKETGRTILFPFPRRWKKEKNTTQQLSVFVEGEKTRRWVSRCKIVWAAVHGCVPKGYGVTRRRSDRNQNGYGIANLMCGPIPAPLRDSPSRLPRGEYRIAKGQRALAASSISK